MTTGRLYLFPNLLDEEGNHRDFLPESVDRAVATIHGLIAESEKGGRKFLRRFSFPEGRTFREIPLRLLNEHTSTSEMADLLVPVIKGERWGIVSDCGLPCLADPGAKLVALAREKGIEVEAFAGPSSIIFALLLSGFSGQRFSFQGYLEREAEALKREILLLQKRAQEEQSVQLFIEAPYRSQKLLEQLVQTLAPSIWLCAAWDLTMPSQQVISQPISKWKKAPLPSLEKHPVVFIISAG